MDCTIDTDTDTHVCIQFEKQEETIDRHSNHNQSSSRASTTNTTQMIINYAVRLYLLLLFKAIPMNE